MMSDKNMVFRCIRAPGGRLSGITNTGQQLYGLDDIPYGFNPSPDMAILTFPASAASSGYSSSNDFHASPPDGCMIFFGLYLIPSLCHFIILADSFVMKRRYSLFIKSRYRRTLTGMVSCFFSPSSPTTSMYRDEPHFLQYLSSAYSCLNKRQFFGQTSIFS